MTFLFCIGQFQQTKIYHAWIEFQDKDYCFHTTLQAFYQKEKYYEYRKIKKLYTRKVNEIIFLAIKYELFGLYPEDYAILDSL